MPNTLRALLVDRDADTREMYAEFLRHRGYAVEEAGDGREALAKAIANRPSVIVTETWLPGLSGFELCRVLRADPSTRSIPIVVVTGTVFSSDVNLAESAGASVVLVKPCLPERLGSEVQRLLARTSGQWAPAEAPRREAARSSSGAGLSSGRRLGAGRRPALNRSHVRGTTTTPERTPPALMCTHCDRRLKYLSSRIGGVSARHSEQWDYFECATCRRTFEYRQRTRKLRAYQYDISA